MSNEELTGGGTKTYKAICKCHACKASIEVEFLLPPTEEDKLGFYCDSCESKNKEE
jgi:hypothetical protein